MFTFIDKEHVVLNKPLTVEEALRAADDNDYIEGVVQIKLSVLVNGDYENFLDVISNALYDGSFLMDIQYEIVGCDKHDVVLLLVSGQLDRNYDTCAEG